MSYAIIRNENYKMGQLSYIYRHNERKNTNYSNKDITCVQQLFFVCTKFFNQIL